MIKSFYFQHDYNAHTDVKLLFVRQKLGMEGYGIYWYIIEQLAISGGRMPLKIIPVLSMQMQTPEAKVESVILHFDLFQIIDNHFFSLRLLQQIDYRTFLSESGKKGAALRWATKEANSPPITTLNTKERKGKKEKKVKESIELSLPFSSDLFLQKWNTLKSQPKWLKKTGTSLQASLDQLSKYSETVALEMMNNTIAGNWQGLFELKNIMSDNAKSISQSGKLSSIVKQIENGLHDKTAYEKSVRC